MEFQLSRRETLSQDSGLGKDSDGKDEPLEIRLSYTIIQNALYLTSVL